MAKETVFQHPPGKHVAILAYDSVNDRWQAVHVDASGQLSINVAAPQKLDVNLYGWDGAVARKLALVWGWSANWDENLGGTATGTSYLKKSSVVPVGQVWVLQALSITDSARQVTLASMGVVRASGGIVSLNYIAPLPRNTPLFCTGTFTLGAGDWAQVFLDGTVAGDVINAGLCGYKMSVNQ